MKTSIINIFFCFVRELFILRKKNSVFVRNGLTLCCLILNFRKPKKTQNNYKAMNIRLPSTNIYINKKTQININEVTLLEADVNYTTIHFEKGSPVVIATTLKKVEPLLAGHSFFRIHKKFVLNLQYADKSVLNKDSITLQNNIELKVSRRKRNELKKKLNSQKIDS